MESTAPLNAMDLNLFATIHSHSQVLPIVMEVSTEEKFFELCESFSASWAHLYDGHTGEPICSYSEQDVSWRNN